MYQQGDKIKNKKTNSYHIVESIDVFEEIVLVFTRDKKYIPLNETEFVSKSLISFFFLKLFNGEDLSKEEKEKINHTLKEQKVIRFNSTSDEIEPKLKEFIKNLRSTD